MCQSLPPPQQKEVNTFIEKNNQKALELLMRIQSQLDASRVIATSTVRHNNYE